MINKPKTNEEITKEFFMKHTMGYSSLLEALQAKDLEHKEEKQKIVDGMPYREYPKEFAEKIGMNKRELFGYNLHAKKTKGYYIELRKQFNLK